MDSAGRAQELIRRERLEGLLGKQAVEDVLLAHELFHVTEYRKKDTIYTRTEKVELWRKPFSNRSRMICLGEIGGMCCSCTAMTRRQPRPSMKRSRHLPETVKEG